MDITFDSVFWIVGLSAFLVGLSKGGLPSISMLAVPLMALVMSPISAAALLLPLYIVSDMVGIFLYRRAFSLPNMKVFLPGALLGIAIGWATAALVSERVVLFMIGLLGAAYCLHTWLKRKADTPAQPVDAKKGWFWGGVAGYASFISHSGGPPFQIYMLPQKLPKAVYAGTSTLTFALINWAKLVPYQMLRPYDLSGLTHTLAYVPFAIVGTVVGAWATHRIADRWFFRLVQATLFLVSIKLMGDALLG